MFDSVMQMWMICMLVFLSLLEWKPLVKMKMVVDLYFGVKMWDKLFYLLGESNAEASCMGKIFKNKKKMEEKESDKN